MADTERVKANLEKMIGMGAPESDIDLYLASEGYKSPEDWRRAIGKQPSFGRRALDAVGDAVKTVGYAKQTADDYLTTQAARAAGGLASLPGTIAKGAQWGYDALGIDPASIFGEQGAQVLRSGATDYPTADKISGAIQGAVNRKPVNLEGNIPGGKIIDTGMQGVLGTLMTGGASAPALMAGAFGGAGSEAAGQAAQSVAPEWETEARIMGALGGGVTGAVAPSVVRKGADAVKAARAPFTQAGQEKIVGTALRDAAADPDAAIAGLDKYTIGREAYPDAVPGFRVDAGKASRDPGLMAVAETAKPARPTMGLQVQENNRLVTEALDRAQAGLPPASTAGETIQTALAGRKDALEATRKAVTDPMYSAAKAFPEDLPVGRLFQYTAKAIAENKGEAKAIMERAQKLLLDAKGRPDFSARGLVAARTELGDMLSSPTLGKHAKELLLGMRQQVDDVLQTVPQAREATTTFREMSRPLDPFNPKLGETERTIARVVDRGPYGGNFTMPAEKVPQTLMRPGGMSAPQVQKIMTAAGGDKTVKQAMASAYLDDFRAAAAPVAQDAAGNPMVTAAGAARWLKANRGGATNVLTPEQIGALDDIARHLTDQAQTVPGRVGSPTFDRLASQSILSALIGRKEVPAWMHPIQKALTLNGIIDIYGGANKQMLDRVLDVISDPAVTAALMKKATPGNVKMVEPLLLEFGRGTAAGGLPTLSGERGTP